MSCVDSWVVSAGVGLLVWFGYWWCCLVGVCGAMCVSVGCLVVYGALLRCWGWLGWLVVVYGGLSGRWRGGK